MLTLIALNGQDKGRVFQLNGETPELLGRQAPMLKLADAQTSRKHAEICLQNNTWLIRDLGSTNGTWVNGQKITQITELEVGDRIVMGRHQFRVSQISNLPAPTPQPKTTQPEPRIGHEELADMGVDLSESLSADILDEDGELPKVAEDALIDESALDDDLDIPLTTAPPAALEAASDDALVDLDALLADEGVDLGASGTSAPVTDESQAQPQQTTESIEAPEEEESPAASQTPVSPEDGVIDLDAILGDDAAVDQAEDVDVPSAEAETPDTEIEDTSAPQEAPAQAVSKPSADDNVFDIDELLGDEVEGEAGSVSVGHEQGLDVSDDDEAIDEVELPTEPELSEAEAEQEVDSTEADESDDDIIDLDAQLQTPDQTPEVNEPDSSNVDALGEVEAMDSPAEVEPSEPAEAEDQPETDEPVEKDTSDSLIDIDVLATAVPTGTLGDKPDDADIELPGDDDLETELDTDTDQQPDDAIDEVLGDLSDELDQKPEPSSDIPDDVSAEDSAIETPVEIEDETTTQQNLQAEDDGLAGIDRTLLLSENEQAQAVSSYKKSRVKMLVIVVICLVIAGVGGFFGYNYISSLSGASAQSNDRNTVPTNNRNVVDDNRQPDVTPAPQSKNTTPPPTKQTTPPPTPVKQADSTNATPNPKKPIADPFADLDVPLDGDPFNLSNAKPEQTAPDTDATETQTPSQESDNTAGERTEQAEPTSLLDTTPEQTQASSDAETLALATGKPEQQSVSITETDTGTPNNDLELLAGVIDTTRSQSDKVNEAATLLGARKIVYVVDASGSLVDSFPRVLKELDSEVAKLLTQQAFTVIFFGSDGVTEVPPVGLRWANDMNKHHLRRWIAPQTGNVNAWGRGDPLEALRKAFSYQPNEVVILSDNLIGRQVSQEDVTHLLDTIAEMSQGKVEMIHVVQFFDRDPQQVLKSIADRFHGNYNQVTNTPSPDAQTAVDEDPFKLQ